jgi:hypothetical protein
MKCLIWITTLLSLGTPAFALELKDIDLSGTWNIPGYGEIQAQLQEELLKAKPTGPDSYIGAHRTYVAKVNQNGQAKVLTLNFSEEDGVVDLNLSVENAYQSEASRKASQESEKNGTNSIPEGFDAAMYRVAAAEKLSITLYSYRYTEDQPVPGMPGVMSPGQAIVNPDAKVFLNRLK